MQILEGKTSVNILRNMYFANIHSHLRCSILFWGSDGESNKMLKLQKTVMRLISNVGRDTSCRLLLKTLNILPAPCVYIIGIVYCTKISIVWLEQNSVRHNYNTCHRSDLQSQYCRADIYTGCHRRNGPNFGRVFLMLKYTDITQNTYIQS